MIDKKHTIFVIQPFLKATEGVYELITSACAKAGVSVFRADTLTGNNIIMEQIHSAIQNSTLIIADVSNANPNVMYEVGFAQAQKKPIIYIANNSRNIPFDLAGIRIIIYDLFSPSEFINSLARTIGDGIREPQIFTFSNVLAEREKRQNVFISYSHRDREYLDRLLIHLKPLEKEGLIDLWVDTRIKAGERWKKEIDKALKKATVAILLVSADFLASDFITDNELPPLLRNAEERGTRIIPLVIKPCRFTRDKNLKHFQSLNDPSDAIVLLSEGDQEKYYDLLAEEVERTLQNI